MARRSLDDLLNGVTRFGRLTVLEEGEGVPSPGNGTLRRALCRCDCGTEKLFYVGNLKKGASLSCGCRTREVNRDLRLRHGESARKRVAPEYRVWSHIIGRCENPNDTAYHNYGGRGISVCRRWRESYEAFLSDVGRRPSDRHSIDRIDNDGDYKPGNVRWATSAQQMRNVRINRWITYGGRRLCLKDAAETYGIKRATLAQRLDLGWSVKDALTTAVGAKR